MSDYILKTENIKKSFGGVHALKGVSLAIKKGEIHCLAGENGCGKSTLIKVISGFYQSDGGSLEIDGIKRDKITPKQAIEAGIQVIYQDFSVFPNLTVMENLSINQELYNNRKLVNWKRLRSIAEESLLKINAVLDLDELVENLSVANKQLVAICRALLGNAKLIIMDEPTTALTSKEVKALFKIIRQLQSQGISILFVSHKLDEVFEISDSFTILRSGENVFSGVSSELDNNSFSFYMTGREFGIGSRPVEFEDSGNILEVSDLTLLPAYKDITFKLKRGEILGITGLLGSGRTEVVQTLFGYRQAQSGKIVLDGEELSPKNVKTAIRKGIGYVPEDRLTEGLLLARSIQKNMFISKWDEMSNSFGILDQKRIDEETATWIDKLSIATKDATLPVQTLSGGNQQKVVLARWLSLDLKILILNGPTVGVDIGAKHDIHALIRKLAQDGLSVIIISDDIPELLQTCHRALIMQEGRLTGELDLKEITMSALSEAATSV